MQIHGNIGEAGAMVSIVKRDTFYKFRKRDEIGRIYIVKVPEEFKEKIKHEYVLAARKRATNRLIICRGAKTDLKKHISKELKCTKS